MSKISKPNNPPLFPLTYIPRHIILSNNASDAYSATPINKPSKNCWPSESDISIGSPNYKPTNNCDGKEIDLLHSSTTPMKSGIKKGMASVVLSHDLPAVTRHNKVLPTPLGKNKSKGKAVAMPSSHSTVMKHAMERAKATLVPSDYLPSLTRNKEKETRPCLGPEEIKDIGKSVVMYSNSLHPHNSEENMKKEVAILRCPLLMKSTMRKRSNEINNPGQIKPCINPHLKKAKKRSIKQETDEYALPRDYCEKQRAYYKEIDDFELQEEEITYQELNK